MNFSPAKVSGLVAAFVLVRIFIGAPVAAAQETILHSFIAQTSDGTVPSAGVISDAKGNLYGTTISGGAIGAPFGSNGIIFELSPATGGVWTEKVLYNFGTASGDGTRAAGGLIFDAKGNLYGTTAAGGTSTSSCSIGCGTVFELSPGSGGVWTEKVLHRFGASSTDGFAPKYESLIFDAKGNLYGTTSGGGANGDGIVFELVAGAGGAWTEKVLYSFGAATGDAAIPMTGLIFDAAGNLFGTTLAGGANGYGTVFELSPGTGGVWTEKVLHSFANDGVDGSKPNAPVVFDTEGNLYGITEYGGAFGGGMHLGAVFELSPNAEGTWTEQILYSFTAAPDGDYPVSGLVFDMAGNLYGTTTGGGPGFGAGNGAVFELVRATGWKEQQVYSFKGGADGSVPYSSLIFDAAGNLYATTSGGGAVAGGGGTVYEIASVVTAAPKFSPAGGAYSTGQSVKITDATPNSTIYYTINGGLSPTKYTAPIAVSSSETITAYAISGTLPQSQAASANYQIGTIAATPWFSPAAGTYTVAQSVAITDAAPKPTIYYTTDGTTPTTSSPKYAGPISVKATETIKALAVATGYTNSAMASAKYTIMPVVPPTEKVLYNFGATGADGDVPLASMVRDSNGNLYGTTKFGGPNQITYGDQTVTAGTAFELIAGTGGTWTKKTLHNFGTSSDGALPIAGLVFDSKGNLYGTTLAGGAYGLGTVFELSPGTGGTWTEKALYSFGVNLSDGKIPLGPVIFDAKGNLYGTTSVGGTSDTTYGGGDGTVFELSPGTGGKWTEKTLYNFSYLSQKDGYFPEAGLVFDAAGNLYGTTADGGSGQDLEGGGTVFELISAGNGWTEKILYNFGGGAAQGYQILGGVVLDGAGNLYGVATSGGNGFGLDGTLLELSPSGSAWNLHVLHSFGAYEGDGISPTAGLVFDAAGDLYGTTYKGGANGYGTVFEMTPQTGGGWFESVVHSFNLSSTDGANPSAALIVDANGNLYGTTAYGGSHGDGDSGMVGGTVYEMASNTTTKTPTTTTLISSVNPSAFGQSVTFTATVKSASGTPTGTVTFKNGTATLKVVTLSGGVAKYTNATLAVGTHSITAVYNGSARFAASTSAGVSQVVTKARSTTALLSSVNPSVFGQAVTFTATVAPQFSGTPAGTATFKNGTVALKTVTLTGGVATYINTTLAVGTHSITAVYNGSSGFTASTSNAVSQVVKKVSTTTVLVSSVDPSTVGQSVTFTATVAPQFSGTPGGSVTFKNGTVTMGSVALSAGVAAYTTSALTSGKRTITATYTGSPAFTTSSGVVTGDCQLENKRIEHLFDIDSTFIDILQMWLVNESRVFAQAPQSFSDAQGRSKSSTQSST